MNKFRILFCLLSTLQFISCQQGQKDAGPTKTEKVNCTIIKSAFGETPDGPVDIWQLKNNSNMEVHITNYGGIIQSIIVPDHNNKPVDVALGFETIDGYLAEHPYFGAIIGRYGNRIGKGVFTIDGTSYNLANNNGPNHLHGGVKGFDKVVWTGAGSINEEGQAQLVLQYYSKDGEEGYPGNLDAKVVYTLTQDNELKIEYLASTDQPTHVNLTNHSYFNLDGSSKVLDHVLRIAASRYTPVDNTLIPTRVLEEVANTPFDFINYKKIGAEIDSEDEQIDFGLGYDHNFVFDQPSMIEAVASVRSLQSGIEMRLFTEEPGVQFYTGNFLDGSITGKGGRVYGHRSALCLETQHFPDSPNQADFPSTLLLPGQEYSTTTIYSFHVIPDK